MFKSMVPDIFGKNILFFVHSVKSDLPTVQNNKQIFCKTWHSLNINFILIMKFNLETQLFFLCPNVAGFLKNAFKQQISTHLKKKNLMTSILMWLGQGNEVAHTPPLMTQLIN